MCCSHRVAARAAFSLLEVMVVLVIIGMMAGLITVNVTGKMAVAKHNAAKAEIASLQEEVEHFFLVRGRYPSGDEGLVAVISDERNPASAPPVDPWGQEYIYASPDLDHPYVIMSLGADGIEGGEGADRDLDNWSLKDAKLTD